MSLFARLGEKTQEQPSNKFNWAEAVDGGARRPFILMRPHHIIKIPVTMEMWWTSRKMWKWNMREQKIQEEERFQCQMSAFYEISEMQTFQSVAIIFSYLGDTIHGAMFWVTPVTNDKAHFVVFPTIFFKKVIYKKYFAQTLGTVEISVGSLKLCSCVHSKVCVMHASAPETAAWDRLATCVRWMPLCGTRNNQAGSMLLLQKYSGTKMETCIFLF